MHIILFGFKGVGKTTVGKALSVYSGKDFIDTDECIQSAYPSLSIFEIYQKLGERAFRELEHRLILQIHPKHPSIIALGGGAPLHPLSLHYLQSIGKLFHLKASLETLKHRQQKPSFISSIEDLYHVRMPLYEKISACTIDVDGLTQHQIITRILDGK